MVELDGRLVDLGVVFMANLVNLLVAGLMLSRPAGRPRLERGLGWVTVALAFPAAFAAVLNLQRGRDWWAVAFPALLALHLVVELLADYILHVEWRQTRWLGPMLALFYFAQMGMIGYSFGVGEPYGAATLVTYFACLFATWYSYARVKHGVGTTAT